MLPGTSEAPFQAFIRSVSQGTGAKEVRVSTSISNQGILHEEGEQPLEAVERLGMAVYAAAVDFKADEPREASALAAKVENVQLEEREDFAPAPPPKVNVWKQRQETRKPPAACPETIPEASAKAAADNKEVQRLSTDGPSKTSTGDKIPIPAGSMQMSNGRESEIDATAWPTPDKKRANGAKAPGEKEDEEKKILPQSSLGPGKTKKWISITPTILHTPLPSKTNFRGRPNRGRGNCAPAEEARGRAEKGKSDPRARPVRAGSVGSNVRHDKQGMLVSPILPEERSSTFHEQVGGAEKRQNAISPIPQTPNGEDHTHRPGNQFHRRGCSMSNKASNVSQISPNLSNLPAAGQQMSNFGYHGMPRTYPTVSPYQSRYPQMQDYQMQLAMGYPIYDMTYQHIMVLQNQMEYYFSDNNLLGDMFLRKNMDSQGFVQLALILEWPRMKALNADLHTLRLACFNSPLLHYIGEEGIDRVRKSEAWRKWFLEMDQREPNARVEGPSNLMGCGFNRDDQAQRLSSVAPPFVPSVSARDTCVAGEYPEYEIDVFPNEAARHVVVFTGARGAKWEKKEQINGADAKEDGKVNGGSVSPGSTVTDESRALSGHGRQEVGWAVHHEYSSSHPVHGECNKEAYLSLHDRAIKDRQSPDMHIQYRFWCHFLQGNWNRAMYDEFRTLAVEDANNEDR